MRKIPQKLTALILSTVTLMLLAGCNGNTGFLSLGKKSHTLMIYMIGSDLEAKGGAGTQDLTEIAESGVDTDSANVIVYSGGSPKWHNDNTSADSHTLLELTGDGFISAESFSPVSMGESTCLSDFLTYAYENYPADTYSLIMWNHGNGPLIGYGKDMLFDDDTLTLSEMSAALKRSPFGTENRLSWVGFDACLMASAELLSVWKDYASYLVASQEIEPAFGWDYSFIKNLTTASSEELTTDITENYLSSCEEYYDERGFDSRDTTLSCIDLSYTGKLEDAINSLFRKAKSNLSEDYNILAVSRVNSRALGRASTGSEYDLVDLMDMTKQMNNYFPEECSQLQSIIEEATVSNQTNADGLCGISLYYPFYNKDYYKSSWHEEYKNLGVLEEYAAYLSEYCKFWLEGKTLLTQSNVPEREDDDTYSITLSAEQSADFASANYYILQREGEGIYTKIYSSSQTEKKGNKLSADFDGNVLYVGTDINEYVIPQTKQYDTAGDGTRYDVFVRMNNSLPVSSFDYPEGYEHKAESYLFKLTVDNKTKEISQSALVPDESDKNKNSLFGGKLEDADLSQWSTLGFLNDRHRYISRYENGLLKPVDEWDCSDFHSGHFVPVENFTGFTFMPLEIGEYYFLFEIEDVYGSRYCSEMYPISIGQTSSQEDDTAVELKWKENEDRVLLIDEQNVSVYLTTEKTDSTPRYTLEAENRNDFPICIEANNFVINDSIYLLDSYVGKIILQPSEKGTAKYSMDLGAAEEYGKLSVFDEIESLYFYVNVEKCDGKRIMVYERYFDVSIPPDKSFVPDENDTFPGIWYSSVKYPANDIFAEEHVIYEKNGLRISVAGLGGEYENYLSDSPQAIKCLLKYENLTDKPMYVGCMGGVMDNISLLSHTYPFLLPAKLTAYDGLYLQTDNANKKIISPSSLSLYIVYSEHYWLPLISDGGAGFLQYDVADVNLSQRGTGAQLPDTGELYFSDHSIELYLNEIKPAEESGDDHEFLFTLVNNSDLDIAVSAENIKTGNEASNAHFSSDGLCAAHTKASLILNIREDYVSGKDITADLYIYDLLKENILYLEKDAIKLNVPE